MGTSNLAVWVWVERHETDELTGIIGSWMVSSAAAEQASALVHDQRRVPNSVWFPILATEHTSLTLRLNSVSFNPD